MRLLPQIPRSDEVQMRLGYHAIFREEPTFIYWKAVAPNTAARSFILFFEIEVV